MSEAATLTPEMIAVLGILGLTLILFVTEIVRVDVAALLILVILGVTGLVGPDELFSGFASNAVISIIAVMIIGAGLDRTGLMHQVAGALLRVGGRTERRIVPMISGTVGVISGFMQNIGAAALFLPVVSRIAARTGLPLSRLLMPMGFCAILGGTLTLVASSPLILLNDLIATSNANLPEAHAAMEPFGLFSVTPVGLALLAAGILYFVVLGRVVLPDVRGEDPSPGSTLRYFEDLYGIRGEIRAIEVRRDSALAGRTIETVESEADAPFVVAMDSGRDHWIAPARDVTIPAGARLAVLGDPAAARAFADRHGARLADETGAFDETLNPDRTGIAEVVIPPGSTLIGRSVKQIGMRKRYRLSVLAVYRRDAVIRQGIRDVVFAAGDTLVVHCAWADLARLTDDRDLVIVTDFPRETLRPHKLTPALAFFALAIGLVIFSGLPLSVCLLTGALGMIVTGVLGMDEAYAAVSWKTVFLLAGLIPLGVAVEQTGTARWIAEGTLALTQGVPVWGLQAAVAVLATVFSLVMSNVGATVLLVPLAVNLAVGSGGDPAIFALTVAIATSNAFLIPTHQVNALIMGPGGYRVADFIRAGGIMTVLFLAVALVALNLFF